MEHEHIITEGMIQAVMDCFGCNREEAIRRQAPTGQSFQSEAEIRQGIIDERKGRDENTDKAISEGRWF